MHFFGLLWAKMTKIGIPNPKLNVTNDYQQFLAHFEWFLSLFQISDVKYEFLLVKLKVCKNGISWAKNLILKIFSLVIFVPQSKLCEKFGSKWPLNGFYRGGQNLPPLPFGMHSRCCFM